MRIEDLTAEQVAQGNKCETIEERLAFVKENGIELTDEQMEAISGGTPTSKTFYKECEENPNGSKHYWVRTGNTRPGSVFGDLWPDTEFRCKWCGKTKWKKWE